MMPRLTLRNAIYWSTSSFPFAGCEAGAFMADEMEDSRRTLLPSCLLTAAAYIAGTLAMLLMSTATIVVAGVAVLLIERRKRRAAKATEDLGARLGI